MIDTDIVPFFFLASALRLLPGLFFHIEERETHYFALDFQSLSVHLPLCIFQVCVTLFCRFVSGDHSAQTSRGRGRRSEKGATHREKETERDKQHGGIFIGFHSIYIG